MQELTILSDIESLLPPLSEEEFAELKERVQAEGIRDALVVWNNTLMDGHHRYRLAKELDIPFDTREMTFDSLDDAKLWIIKNQSGRRNMTPYARTSLALKLKETIAEKALQRKSAGKKIDPVPNWAQGREKGEINAKGKNTTQNAKTRDQIAQIADVGKNTVSRVEFIDKYADEETKDALRRGDVSVNKVYTQLKAVNETPVVVAKSDEETIQEPTDAETDECFANSDVDDSLAAVREPCVTLQMINRVNPEPLIEALFDLFDNDYRCKFVKMFFERTMEFDGKAKAASLLSSLDKMIR